MSKSPRARLEELHELVDAGLMSPEEYEASRKAIIEETTGVGASRSSSASLSGSTTVGPAGSAGNTDVPAPAGRALAGGTQVAGMATAAPLAGGTLLVSQSSPGSPGNPSTPLEIPDSLGNYKVLGVIGAGGMGTVVRARHVEEGWATQQGGDVAIKLIHPHISAEPAFRERFFAEAALGKRVQHPGLATVYDVVSDDPWLGTILEYIDGRELSEWVQAGGLTLDEVLALLQPLAEALEHLHGQGIIHRDLKPANVKVRPDGQPVLLDLGIAKDLSGRSGGQTQTMTAMGTSAWMAPEQADAKSVTCSADVYALGLIAYALLSGRMPWGDGESELRVLTNKMIGRLNPLSEAQPGLPPAVHEAVRRVLSVDPDARPTSATAFLAELRGEETEASRQVRAAAAASAAARLAEEQQAKAAAAEQARAAEEAREEAERAKAGAARARAAMEQAEAARRADAAAREVEAAARANRGVWMLLLIGVAALLTIGGITAVGLWSMNSVEDAPSTSSAASMTTAVDAASTGTTERSDGLQSSVQEAVATDRDDSRRRSHQNSRSVFPASGSSSTLIVGTGRSFPPMFDTSGEEPEGFDIDLARALAPRLGKDRVRFATSKSPRRQAESGDVDLAVAAVSITPARKKSHLFSDPYLVTNYILAARRSLGRSVTASTRCAVGSNPIYRSMIKKAGCNVRKYGSQADAVASVLRGDQDVVLVEESQLSDPSLSDLVQVESLSRDTLGVVLQRGNDTLKDQVDKALIDLERDGTLTRLRRKHGL